MSKIVTKGSDYALLMLSDLARQPEGEVLSVHQMAERNHLPQRFIANIVSKLIQAGILTSKRGFNGGIQLARPGAEISFRDVIEAVEGPVVFMDCQRGEHLCDQELGCRMKSLWGEIQHKLVQSLERTTIGDVARGKRDPDELPVLTCGPDSLGLAVKGIGEEKEGRGV